MITEVRSIVGAPRLASNEASRALPWPAAWVKSGRATPIALTVMFVLFSFAAIPAGLSALRGDPDPRAAMGGLSILMSLPLAGLTYVSLVRRRRSTAPLRPSRPDESDLAGLAFPYDRAFIVCSVPLVAALNVGALAVVILGVIRLQAGSAVNGALLTVVGIVVGFMGVRFGLEIVAGRITRGALVLTPDGITHRSWAFDSECSWRTVLSVDAVTIPAPSIQISNTQGSPAPVFVERTRRWRQVEAKTAPHLIVRAMYLSIDPALVLETLRFYAAYPLLRDELGTQAAIDRVRRGDVDRRVITAARDGITSAPGLAWNAIH